jgi:hypothetical protein
MHGVLADKGIDFAARDAFDLGEGARRDGGLFAELCRRFRRRNDAQDFAVGIGERGGDRMMAVNPNLTRAARRGLMLARVLARVFDPG